VQQTKKEEISHRCWTHYNSSLTTVVTKKKLKIIYTQNYKTNGSLTYLLTYWTFTVYLETDASGNLLLMWAAATSKQQPQKLPPIEECTQPTTNRKWQKLNHEIKGHHTTNG